MNPLNKTYPDKFFRKREGLVWRAQVLCPTILEVLNPKSIIDVGCAIGDFVKWFDDNHIEAWGIEGSEAAKPYSMCPEKIIYQDMRLLMDEPLRQCDLAMSVEVAEHIEPECAEIYVKNLTLMSKLLLLTIAGPGQAGHSHVNLQPPEYWDDLFAKFHYVRDKESEERIRKTLMPHRANRWVATIAHNLVIYKEDKP
jgi:hypothetical protein